MYKEICTSTHNTLVPSSGLGWLRSSSLPEDPTEDAARNLGRGRVQSWGNTPGMEPLVAVLAAPPALLAIVAAPALQPDGANAAGVPELLELCGSILWLVL